MYYLHTVYTVEGCKSSYFCFMLFRFQDRLPLGLGLGAAELPFFEWLTLFCRTGGAMITPLH